MRDYLNRDYNLKNLSPYVNQKENLINEKLSEEKILKVNHFQNYTMIYNSNNEKKAKKN